MVKIYIVTPSYNAVKTLDRTIESVVLQLGCFEIHYHVQDGGSTDGTIDLLKKWKKKINRGLHPIKSQNIEFSYASERDSGMYDAIARGFERFTIAACDWMTWINSDDTLQPGAFALLALIDDQHEKDRINWVTGDASIAINSLLFECYHRPLNRYIISNGMCDGKHWEFVQQEGTFFRNALWRKLDIQLDFLRFRYAADWNMWRVFAVHEAIYQVPYPLGTFTRRTGQISQTHRTEYEAEIDATVPSSQRLKALYAMEGQTLERQFLLNIKPDNKITISAPQMTEKHAFWYHKATEKKRSRKMSQRGSPAKTSSTLIHAGESKSLVSSALGYDADWHLCANSEQHAFRCTKILPKVPGVVYFGFPWATLIDNNYTDPATTHRLSTEIKKYNPLLFKNTHVVTVCQHIELLKHQRLFSDSNINHVFWSFSTKGLDRFPDYPEIKIYPFPLNPFRVITQSDFTKAPKKYLFSFIRDQQDDFYLKGSWPIIIESLSRDKRGLVFDIQNKQGCAQKPLGNDVGLQIIANSTFSLCPIRSNFSMVRLWESIGCGSIPVMFSSFYLPPGNQALWEEATVTCPESFGEIRALPDRLDALVHDLDLLRRKQNALRQLWQLYGPDWFIYDIYKLFLSLAQEKSDTDYIVFGFSCGKLLALASAINRRKSIQMSDLDFFIINCSSMVISDPLRFLSFYEKNAEIRTAYKLALSSCNLRYSEAMKKNLKFKGVVLN